jgi:hypothetical protein
MGLTRGFQMIEQLSKTPVFRYLIIRLLKKLGAEYAKT